MIEWSDRQGHRDRHAWAVLVLADETLVPFTGASILGVVAVIGDTYCKDGKWSHTTYRLQVFPGVRFLAGHDGWNTGRRTEGIASAVGGGVQEAASWDELSSQIGAARASVESWRRASAPGRARCGR